MNATLRLYYDDAYLTAFSAVALDSRRDALGLWLALDQTAFYPTSGGQPYDTGLIAWEGESARVLDVTVSEDIVWHRVDRLPPAGARVRGEIDWPRRLDHMQQHAADHMLAGAAFALYGGMTIGLHLGETESTIDMDLPGGRTRFTAEEIQTLENTVNARVQHNDPIRCWFPDEAELNALPLRKRPTVKSHVRVVAMGDYEMVACGGTHPSSTGQLGAIKILSAAPARGKLRLSFVAGMRALAYFQRCAGAAESMSALLSATVDTACEALQHERENAQAQMRALREALQDAALAAVKNACKPLAGDKRLYAMDFSYGDRQLLVRVASALAEEGGCIALLSCPDKAGHALVFACGANVESDMSALLRSCGAKGGGKSDMAQGSAQSAATLWAAADIVEKEMGNG